MIKVFVVQNPVAGVHSANRVENLLRSRLDDLGWDYELYQTKKGDSVVDITARAREEGFEMFIAAGGDGTVSAVASALVGSDLPLFILPAGTGNGLARDLNLPLRLENSINAIGKKHDIQGIDAMQIGERYFLLNLSVGLTPAALKLTDRKEKRRLGRLAYILAGLRALVGIQPVNFKLTIDGEGYHFRASELILFNSVTLGNPGRFLELGIENDDGKLELFIFQSRTILDYLRVFWNFLIRRPQTDPDLIRFSVHHSLRLEAVQALEVQADGDLIGYTPVEVTVLQRTIKIVVPN